MGSLESEAVQTIAKLVASVIPKDDSYDKTIEGEIVSIEADGFYVVDIRGKTYKTYSPTDLTFTLHERVWVTIPCNDMSKLIIFGRKRGV